MSVAFAVVAVAFVAVAVVMLALILVQRRGSVTPLFGGGGHSPLGVHAPAAVVWMTAGAFALFLTLAVVLNLLA